MILFSKGYLELYIENTKIHESQNINETGQNFVGQNISSDKIFIGQNFSSDQIFVTKPKFRQFCPTKGLSYESLVTLSEEASRELRW